MAAVAMGHPGGGRGWPVGFGSELRLRLSRHTLGDSSGQTGGLDKINREQQRDGLAGVAEPGALPGALQGQR